MVAASRQIGHGGRAVGVAVAVLGLAAAMPAAAGSRGNPAVGRTLAQHHCSQCHAIDRTGQSPLAIAPPLRSLHMRYPVENLAEALAEGITTGHPTMPEYRFDPDQVEHLIVYLKTLEQ